MNGKTDKSRILLSLSFDQCVGTHQCTSEDLNTNCTNTKIPVGPNALARGRTARPDRSTQWKCVMKSVTHFGSHRYSACVFSILMT